MYDMTVKTWGLANVSKSIAKKIFKSTMEYVGNLWKTTYYPMRFLPMGAFRYGLRNRSAYYKKFIKKIYPHWRPLRATGELERVSQAGGRVRAITKGDNCQAKITFPRAHPTQKYLSEELTRVTPQELQHILQSGKEQVIAQLKTIGTNTTARKGIR